MTDIQANNTASLSEQIQIFSDEIKDIDPATSERLADIGRAFDKGEFWINLDLDRLFNISSFIEKTTTYYSKRGWRRIVIPVMEISRNLLVLLPIIITWNGLRNASTAYREVIASNPDLISRPFLLQWQEGFPGYNISTFSEIAFWDAFTIIFVLLLTFLVLFLNTLFSEKAEEKANSLGNRLQNLLWQTMKEVKPLLARQVSKADTRSVILIERMEKVIAGFESHNQGFEKLLERQQLEMNNLINARNKELQNLQGFIITFEKAVAGLSAFSTQFLGILEDIKSANRTTSDSFAKLNELANQIKQLEVQISQLNAAIIDWGQKQQRTFTDLVSTTNTIFGRADSIANAIPEINSAVDGLTRAQTQLVSLFTDQKENTNNWVTELQVSIRQTKEASDEIQKSILSLNELSKAIHLSLSQSHQNSNIIQSLGTDIRGAFTVLHDSIFQLDEKLKVLGNIFNQSVEHLGSLATSVPGTTAKLSVLDKINDDLVKLQASIKEMNVLLNEAGNAMEATHYSNMEFANVLEREMSNLRSYIQRKL